MHVAVDTLGHLLAAVITPSNEADRGQVDALCQRVQQVTGQKVQVAYVDQDYTGEDAAYAAAVHDIDVHDIDVQVITKPAGKTGFVLLPRRLVVESSFGWAARFRRLARDYESLALTMQQFHFLAFATLLLAKGVFRTTSP